ncbi:MAG: NADH-quinone oxidoreductase subunit M [Candidatus Zixiibacteriota bacterium]|nr:MAG: NADH-quinone oxidoreductase subunit M [candidate division Zixibacteria bacterium]
MYDYVLSSIIFLPLAGFLVILFLPKNNFNLIRWVASIFSFVPMVISFYLIYDYFIVYSGSADMVYIEGPFKWISVINAEYFLGADGISVPLLALTGLLSFLSIIASFNIVNRVKEYFAFFLLLETGMMGVFCALDFFLFYVFWEVMLVPMYFLIGVWGGPRKEYAAIKFFLYTLFGSIFMLVAILVLYFTSEPHTLNMLTLIQTAPGLGHSLQLFCFAFLFVAFAIKVPVWPFHTWLPDAHVEAPTAVSVILAGVLLKMGTYGMLRISWPMFPEATRFFAIPVALLGLIAIIYGALVSMAQKDLKKLVAYSSVSHMGYCMLALGAWGSVTALAGCMFQMVSHGLITGALFLMVGVLYDRAHTREIAAFGGLGVKLPIFTGLMVLFSMASLGLPGMSGFISEFMVFIGSFSSFKLITALAVLGVVLTAGYMLRMVQRIFLGEFNMAKWGGLAEMNAREILMVAPLAALTVAIGVYPSPLSNVMKATLENLVNLVAR